MATKVPVEFKHDESGLTFEATATSFTDPEPSWFQWVLGLPDELQVPDVSFHTTHGPTLLTLVVSSTVETKAVIFNEEGAILCQITGVFPLAYLAELRAAATKKEDA